MLVDVSIGEAIDKWTILKIKSERVKDEIKLGNIIREKESLEKDIGGQMMGLVQEDCQKLLEINGRLWDIEDQIRIKESEKNFEKDFIELARSVYFVNDERAEVKKTINLKCGSKLIEEKQYVNYRGVGT